MCQRRFLHGILHPVTVGGAHEPYPRTFRGARVRLNNEQQRWRKDQLPPDKLWRNVSSAFFMCARKVIRALVSLTVHVWVWHVWVSSGLHLIVTKLHANLPTTRDLKLCTMYKILNNTFSFHESIINLRSRFQTYPMSTRCVYKHVVYSLRSHKLLYEFFCTKYLNSMEWPPLCHHMFVYTFSSFKNYSCLAK